MSFFWRQTGAPIWNNVLGAIRLSLGPLSFREEECCVVYGRNEYTQPPKRGLHDSSWQPAAVPGRVCRQQALCYHAHLMGDESGQQSGVKSKFRVRDYMTSTVTTLTVDARLLDAALLIRRTGKRHVPVVSADGKAIGIISDRDISRLAPSVLSQLSADEYNKIFEGTSVTLAMTKDPVTIHPDAPVQQAVHVMISKKFSSVLVAEADGKLVGIITVTDLLSLLDRVLTTADTV